MKVCKRCGLPETYETIEYDEEGICNICRSTEHKRGKIDWVERKKVLDQLIEKHRGKQQYDCIVPFSGGKDSTFQLYYLIKEYKLKPLVVRFNHGFLRSTIRNNTTKTLKKLGADMIEFTPNWHIVKKLMLESFKRKTDFCWHCHTGIYSYPLRIALLYKIPLIFWGEPLAEISAYYDYINDEIEYEDDKRFNMLRTLGITAEDMHNMISTKENPVDPRDLIPYTFPDVKELKKLRYCSVALGSFIPWDYAKNTEIIKKELNWTVDTIEGVPKQFNEHGEKTECFMQASRDYIKYVKRGYSRISQLNAFKARKEELSFDEITELNAKYDGKKPHSLKIFLDYVGLTEEEFQKYVINSAIPPYEHDFENDQLSEKPWDYNEWYQEAI